MDRRQRKTREAIFRAFTDLLSEKDFSRITVGEILERADVGRATFYAHFETKDFLLREFCAELFCHILDVAKGEEGRHRHIFACDGADSVLLHLFEHLQKNDNHILRLLSSENNELFLRYFKGYLEQLVENPLAELESRRDQTVPPSFWRNHVVCSLIGTLEWWIGHGMKESPEQITAYFYKVI